VLHISLALSIVTAPTIVKVVLISTMPSARKKHRSPAKAAPPQSASMDQHSQPSSKKKGTSSSSTRRDKKKQEVSAKHFNFESESRQPGTFHVKSPRSGDDDEVTSYDSLNNVGVCQDEREGLASLLNCGALSPKEGDERADVIEDDDDLFEFFEEDKKKMEDYRKNEEALSKEIAKSFSCSIGEHYEETPAQVKQKKVLSPVSLADDDVTDEDTARDTAGNTAEDNTYTDEDTAGDGTFTTYDEDETLEETLPTIEKAPSKSKKSNSRKSKQSDDPKPKKAKKSVTIHARDEVHEYTVLTPHNSSLRTNSGILIPDDESEASMLVLMRYIGCTSTAYGEARPVPVRVRVTTSEDRSYFGSESDDDTTISGWTQESFRMTRTRTYEEEGIELTIEEFLPPSMRLTRSVSVDEGTVLSEAAARCPSDEEISKRSLDKSMGGDNNSFSSNCEASVDLHKIPKQKTVKKNRSPVGSMDEFDKQEKECSTVNIIASEKVNSPATPTKELKRALPKRKLDLTVKTDPPVPEQETPAEQDHLPVIEKKSIEPKPCLEVDASASQEVISPATMAKNFLSSTGDVINNGPVTSPATEAKNYLAASSKPSVLCATLESATTKGDEFKVISPASKAKSFLAHSSKKTEPVVSHQSIKNTKSNSVTSALPEKNKSTVDAQKQSFAKKPAKKHPVDDLIHAYLSTPRNSKMDNDALIAAMSPTTLKSPSVQMLLKSNLLSPSAKVNTISPSGPVTPKANNVSPSPPQKKPELSRAPVKNTMTPIEKKLSNRNALPPIETYDSMTNIQIDDINSPISPVSAISECTNDDTINTEALISMARRRSRGIVPSGSDMSSVAKKPAQKEPPLFGAIDEGSNESSTKASKESSTTTEVSTAKKAAASSKATPKASNVRIKSKEVGKPKNKKSLSIAVKKNKAADPPEETSSFDKNEVTKENKRTLSPQNATATSREIKEPVAVVGSLDENARDPPPPLVPCRQSVQEVDALLSKTRNWLAAHNASKANNGNSASKVDIQRNTARNLATSASELTIREQLEALKARQTKDRTRQSISKAMG